MRNEELRNGGRDHRLFILNSSFDIFHFGFDANHRASTRLLIASRLLSPRRLIAFLLSPAFLYTPSAIRALEGIRE